MFTPIMRRPRLLYAGIGLAAIIAGAAMLAPRPASARPPLQPSDMPPTTNEGHALLRSILEQAFPGDLDRIAYYEVTAARETGGTFNWRLGRGYSKDEGDWPADAQVNTDVSDGNSAYAAYDRNRDLYADCPWPEARYYAGSYGWFQMFPANALYAFRNTAGRCTDPWKVRDPALSVALARGYEARLKNRAAYKNSPIWLTIAVGWGLPSAMANPTRRANVRETLVKWSNALGWPTSWIDRMPTESDEHPYDLARRLGAVA